jgi:hypothetical protein
LSVPAASRIAPDEYAIPYHSIVLHDAGKCTIAIPSVLGKNIEQSTFDSRAVSTDATYTDPFVHRFDIRGEHSFFGPLYIAMNKIHFAGAIEQRP